MSGNGTTKRQMRLSGFCAGSGSYHQAGWRHPGANPHYASDFSLWIDYARKLEAAKFDMMFVADIIAPLDALQPDIFAYNSAGDCFEPMTWLAALVAHTRHLGLAGTIATSYRPPYDVAREVASLDLISGGRAAWNVVTGISPEAAAQYADQIFAPPEERYARGEEFVDVVLKLWASVPPGGHPHDQKSGIYTDIHKVKPIHHEGDYYRVQGPLGMAPSPQGRPVLAQAGQSEEGRQLASRIADIVFTAQSDFDRACDFYADIRRRAENWGRNPDHVKVLPGCVVIAGQSRQEADDIEGEINALIDLRPAMTRLSMALKFMDLSQYPLDDPFPDVPPEAMISRGANYVEMARKENLTLRQVLIRSCASNAHFMAKGTVSDVVDQMQHWFENGACDGFNILTAAMPMTFDPVVYKVVPELQRRGLFRTEYEGTTLRDNLGLPNVPTSIPLKHH